MITVKGSPKGIVIFIDDTDYETGRQELEEKLSSSADFFKGVELNVFLTSNTLSEAELYFLRDTITRVLTETTVIFSEDAPKLLPQRHSDIDELEADESVTKYVRKTVKNGETVEYPYSVVIIGDVEEGASIVAGGNVTVMGNLFGKVHAGAGGNRSAVVIAMKLMPEKLLISDLSATVKQSTVKRILGGKPEIAYVARNTVKIEQYT